MGKLAQVVTVLICILEMPDSNLSRFADNQD
jgi:hypothetical protein